MTENVNPEMIRLARLSRAKHQTEVASSLGIKQPTYSKIENGQVGISTEQLDRLGEVLGYPPSFFVQTARVWGTASPHHRKRKSLPTRDLEHLEAEINVIRLNIRHLTASVAIDPPFEFPNLDLDEVGTPAEAARQVRRLWRVPAGPITSVTRMIEDAGGIIVEWPYRTDRFDAISIWGPGERPIILLNAMFPADRKRHTLAHELGHLVMHVYDVTDDPERESDAFAGELLMPEAMIRPELRGLRLQRLPDLKRRWRVSMRSIVKHASVLGEITKDQARYMYMRLNQEYGAKREPVPIPPEEPTLLAELLREHITELGYSVDELAQLISRDTDEFVAKFPVEPPRLRAL